MIAIPSIQPPNRFPGSHGLTRVGILGLALMAAIAGVLAWQTMNLQGHSCEVCIAYRGREQCRTVSAVSVEEARQGAITNACAFVSSGVTDSMACSRTKPLREHCE